MSLLKLATTVENLQFEVSRLHRELHAGPGDGKKLLHLCKFHRQLGCGLLLGDRDAAEFQVEIFKSARCYLWLLERPAGQVDPYYLCRSRGAPLIDALAAGKIDLAQRIAALMHTPFNWRMEPEEDFRWFEILGATVISGVIQPDLFAAFEATLKGRLSTRYEAIAGILARDEKAFSRALENLSAEWVNEVARRKGSLEGPYFSTTEAHVCVGGIAIARLASGMGIHVPTRVRSMPGGVLGPVKATFPEGFVP